jgi:hypothetical protein
LENRQIGGTGYVLALISIQIDTEVDLDFKQVANLHEVNVLDNNFAQCCRIDSLKQVFVLNFSMRALEIHIVLKVGQVLGVFEDEFRGERNIGLGLNRGVRLKGIFGIDTAGLE